LSENRLKMLRRPPKIFGINAIVAQRGHVAELNRSYTPG